MKDAAISFGQYYPAQSLLHRLDPRAKVLMTVLYIVCTFLCNNLLGFVALTLSAVLLVALSRIPLRVVLRSLRPILFIIVFTSLINIFMTKGGALLTPEGFPIKHESLVADKARFTEFALMGIKPCVHYGMNTDEEIYRKSFENGALGFTCDHPDICGEILDRIGARKLKKN